MDSLITAAAHALASGNPLGALQRVALRSDPPALALRGSCRAPAGLIAEIEIALASRDLGWSSKLLDAARATLF